MHTNCIIHLIQIHFICVAITNPRRTTSTKSIDSTDISSRFHRKVDRSGAHLQERPSRHNSRAAQASRIGSFRPIGFGSRASPLGRNKPPHSPMGFQRCGPTSKSSSSRKHQFRTRRNVSPPTSALPIRNGRRQQQIVTILPNIEDGSSGVVSPLHRQRSIQRTDC